MAKKDNQKIEYELDSKGRAIIEFTDEFKERLEAEGLFTGAVSHSSNNGSQGVIFGENDNWEPLRYVRELEEYTLTTGLLYGMNRSVSRDNASVLDGLNPIERRIIFIMNYMKLYPNRPPAKLNNIIGIMMDRVYPHGDNSPKNTIQRLARSSSVNIKLIHSDSNIGNPYDKSPGQSRYTSASLTEFTMDCFFSESDASKPIYDTKPDFNKKGEEPIYLPTKYPYALLQYASGIGFGTSNVIPAFNLKELLEATIKLVDDPEAKIDIYPDSHAPMQIINKSDLKGCFDKTHFPIKMRTPYYLDSDIVRVNGKPVVKNKIVFVNTPIGTSGKNILESVVEAKKKNPSNFSEIKNVEIEVSVEEVKLIFEYETGYDPEVIAEKLYKTNLQMTIPAKILFYDETKPVLMTPRMYVLLWIDERIGQLRRYHQQKLNDSVIDKLRFSAIIQLDKTKKIDEFIDFVKNFKGDDKSLIEAVSKKFALSKTQAKYVINMKIKDISKLQMEDLEKKLKETDKAYKYHYDHTRISIIKEDIKEQLADGIKKYGIPRKATLTNLKDRKTREDEIVKYLVYNDMNYYCLKSLSDIYKLEGKIDSSYRTTELQNCSNVLLFMANGSVKRVKGYAFSVSINEDIAPTSFNLMFGIDPIAVIPDMGEKYVTLVTKKGVAKHVEMGELTSSSGCRTISLSDEDDLVAVCATKVKGYTMITSGDKVYYLPVNAIPVMKRTSAGNKVIRGVDDLEVNRVFFVPSSAKRLLISGESGYLKIMSTEFFVVDKKKTPVISMGGKSIHKVMGLGSAKVEPAFLLDTTMGETPITFSDDGKKITVFKLPENKPMGTLQVSTTIGSPVKCIRATKNSFYEILM